MNNTEIIAELLRYAKMGLRIDAIFIRLYLPEDLNAFLKEFNLSAKLVQGETPYHEQYEFKELV